MSIFDVGGGVLNITISLFPPVSFQLSALEVLSPKQTAELVVLPLPGLPGKAVIINTVFDYLSKSPRERKLPEFLYHLSRLSVVVMIPKIISKQTCNAVFEITEKNTAVLPQYGDVNFDP